MLTLRERVMKTTTWRQLGRCRGIDPEIFYPDSDEEAVEAKGICLLCPVRETCLEYALTVREKHGVWGGLTERERRRMLTSVASRPDPDPALITRRVPSVSLVPSAGSAGADR